MSGGPTSPVTVGIDIGGTKTHLRLSGDGPMREMIRPMSSWRRRDWTADAASLLALVRELAAGRTVAAIGVGANGCDDAGECAAFQAAFAAQTDTPVAVINDAELTRLHH